MTETSLQEFAAIVNFPEKLPAVISIHRSGRFKPAATQIQSKDLTVAILSEAVNANQEKMQVPDELEELLSMDHYLFRDFPIIEQVEGMQELEDRYIEWFAERGLSHGEKLKVEWRLRELPRKNSSAAPVYVDYSKACDCGHYREVHDRYFGECKECEIGNCLEFTQQKLSSESGGNK